MPREYAQVAVRIWDDAHFCALPPGPQRLYLFLLSQNDLNHAGVLGLRERRWAQCCAGTTTQDITNDLTVLQQTGFIVVDEDTEEVLVRTYIRNAGVWKQPKLMPAVFRDSQSARSARIKQTIIAEMGRIDFSEIRDDALRQKAAETVNAQVESLSEGIAKATESQAEALRACAGAVPSTFNPLPLTPTPTVLEIAPRKKRATPPAPQPPDPRIGPIVGAYCEGATGASRVRPSESLRARCGKAAGQLLAEGVPVEIVTAAARAMGAAGWTDLALQVQKLPDTVPRQREPASVLVLAEGLERTARYRAQEQAALEAGS
jgi:hypothetical protein